LKKRFELSGYREFEREMHLARAKVTIVYLAVPAVLSWSVIDHYFRPEVAFNFFLIRLTVIPAAIFAFLLLKIVTIKNSKFLYVIPSYWMTLYLGLYSAYLCTRTGYESSIYYAGINLVAIALYGFIPWSFLQLTPLPFLLYAPWFLSVSYKGSPIDQSAFVPNTAFMVSTALIGFVISVYMRRIRVSDFEARDSLATELKSKEQVIREKTKEAVRLERLASQFSPQIIEGIKSEKIMVEKKIRTEVSCIFIDIENSTDRSNKIDYSDYIDALTMFFNRCIEILLKHDVTVGTYLGDGLIAFVNAPQPRENHEIAALDACLEILEDHVERRNIYFEKWHGELNIRIGINTGYCHVGFFPSYNRGTYTALGDSVNLAARLCSKADANTICIQKRFAKKVMLQKHDLDIKKSEQVDNLKGFEDEVFEIYHLGVPKKSKVGLKQNCPQCKNIMQVEADLGVSYYFRCPNCNFQDIRDKDELEIKIAS